MNFGIAWFTMRMALCQNLLPVEWVNKVESYKIMIQFIQMSLMKNLKYSLYFILFALFFVVPGVSFAQSVSIRASKTSYALNESILVTVSVETGGQQINTVGGKLSFSPAELSVSDLRFGNSVVSLWVLKPTANNSLGTIEFTGGVPGGYSGSSGTLFTFTVRSKVEGLLTINFSDIHVLLNDGSGGEIQNLKKNPLILSITPAKTTPSSSTPTSPKEEKPVIPKEVEKDLTPPENFVPMVSRHESVADNAYFVSFFAVDKDSGVNKYEVREVQKLTGISTEWTETTSPYILKTQSWGTKIEVRATDGSGNFVISSADKPFSSGITLLSVAALLLVTILITRAWTKRSARPRRK